VREVLFVVGEASGDLHAGAVAAKIAVDHPDLHMVGIGGDRMRAAGVDLIEHAERLAVMGAVEILRHIPAHYRLLRRLRDRMRSGSVAAVVLVDYPGFNMKVAAAAHAAGVPVLYYITPQVWAWGAGRLPKLARLVSRAAVILPFEEALLRQHGINATFVGHPLLDRAATMPSRAEARAALGIGGDEPVLALFPGSRAQEISRHLAPFLATAAEVCRREPRTRVVISVAATVRIDERALPYPAVRNESFSVLRAADAALCKSGTTTLEAAVAGCPLVIAYRTSGWTYAIARRVVRIPHIGLVNVVAGHQVAREFLQEALEPPAVASALMPLLRHGTAERELSLAGLAAVRDKLGEPGAATRVAHMLSELAS